MYTSKSFTRLNQVSVANELRQILQNNKGSKATVKEQLLVISGKNQQTINIKIFQPSPRTNTRISETRK